MAPLQQHTYAPQFICTKPRMAIISKLCLFISPYCLPMPSRKSHAVVINIGCYLPADGVVMYIHEGVLGHLIIYCRICEPLAENDPESDVIAAPSPLELTGRGLGRCLTAIAFRTVSGAATLRDTLRQSSRRQTVDERLLTTSLKKRNGQISISRFARWRYVIDNPARWDAQNINLVESCRLCYGFNQCRIFLKLLSSWGQRD